MATKVALTCLLQAIEKEAAQTQRSPLLKVKAGRRRTYGRNPCTVVQRTLSFPPRFFSAVTMLEFPPPATSLLKSSGLRLSPQSGGVENATARCDLPSPAVAVRNLVEQAQFAHLCTIMSGMHHRRAGYPFGTVVDFAADGAGYPIFSLSPLAIQTRNIMEDPRCSLVMQMPGWSGLANARVTIFGDVYALPKNLQSSAADIFHQKMSAANDEKGRWVSGNAIYFRMDRILDIYFVGGFGTVQWVDVDEYTSAQPDQIVVSNPFYTLQVLNQTYSESLREYLSRRHGQADDAAFISIDKRGADVRVRQGGDYSVERIGFDLPVECLEDAMASIKRLLAESGAKNRST